MTKGILAIATLFLFTSCFKKDEPIKAFGSDRIEIIDSTFGPAQIYYSLAKKKIVAQNSIYDWDLAFDCSDDGFFVKLNSSKGMGAYNTGNRIFDLDYRKSYYPFVYDDLSGDPSKTAIGNWGDFAFDNPQSFGFVYIVNRGLFEQGRKIGLKKMIIKGYKDSTYHIQFADPDGSNEHYVKIPKSKNRNWVYFTFEEGGKTINIEPSPDSWDIVITPFIDSITHYKYIFKIDDNHAVYDGVLLNHFSRQIAKDSMINFDNISFRQLSSYAYNNNQNAIGKEFWYWDKMTNDYAVNLLPSYILKDDKENYYKFKFVEFRRRENGHLKLCFNMKNL